MLIYYVFYMMIIFSTKFGKNLFAVYCFLIAIL